MFAEWMGEYPRANCPWNQEEENILVQCFRSGSTIEQLVKQHGRNENSINLRLEKLIGKNFITMEKSEKIENLKEFFKKLHNHSKAFNNWLESTENKNIDSIINELTNIKANIDIQIDSLKENTSNRNESETEKDLTRDELMREFIKELTSTGTTGLNIDPNNIRLIRVDELFK